MVGRRLVGMGVRSLHIRRRKVREALSYCFSVLRSRDIADPSCNSECRAAARHQGALSLATRHRVEHPVESRLTVGLGSHLTAHKSAVELKDVVGVLEIERFLHRGFREGTLVCRLQ